MRSAAGVLGWRCTPRGGPVPGHASLSTGPQSRTSCSPGPANSARGGTALTSRRLRATPTLGPCSLRAPLPVSGRRCRGDSP